MKNRQILWRGLLVFGYGFCIVYITLLSRTASLTRIVELELFQAWHEWVSGNPTTGRAILENIGLFIPLGYLTVSFFSAWESPKNMRPCLTALLGFLLSLSIEALQYHSGRGWFDVDDLFNNTLGTALGVLLYRMAAAVFLKQNSAGKGILFGILPALMLISGLFGCWRMNRMVVMLNLHTDQFWFSVDQVSVDGFGGRCFLYDRSTPEYRIFLTHGTERLEAEVVQEGERFSAAVNRADGEKYEIQIRFDGYVTLPTGVYLNGAAVEYVEGEVRVPTGPDGQPLLPDADLKACSVDWDCYVFQSGDELIWLIGSDVPPTAELICHIQTNQPELLPEQSAPYGFENRGFFPAEPDRMLGSYRCFVRPISADYPITSIFVGLNPGSGVVWRSSFRP